MVWVRFYETQHIFILAVIAVVKLPIKKARGMTLEWLLRRMQKCFTMTASLLQCLMVRYIIDIFVVISRYLALSRIPVYPTTGKVGGVPSG